MAKNNTCREFEQIAWFFLDGDMSERERIFWEEHVSSCETCRAIPDEVRAVELAYHGLPYQEPPEAVLSDLRDRLYQPGRLQRFFHNLRNRIPGRRIWQSSLIGAVVVVGSVLLVTFVRHRRSA